MSDDAPSRLVELALRILTVAVLVAGLAVIAIVGYFVLLYLVFSFG